MIIDHILSNLTTDTWIIFWNDALALLPEVFFIISITLLLLYGVIYSSLKEYKFPILTQIIGKLAIQTIFFVILIMLIQKQTYSTYTIFNNVLILDEFTIIIKIIILLCALFSIMISFEFIKGQKINSFEYIILILIATFSMLFLISSFDLISLYLAIELQSLSFYVLAAFQRNNEFSTEAGLKYFILGALSSGFLLFGESLIYGFTGLTNFEEIAKALKYITNVSQESIEHIDFLHSTNNLIYDTYIVSNAIYIGLLFMLVALLFKISAAPFHMWTPDVYEGAPTSITAFFSITPKIAILGLLLRLCLYTFYDLLDSWQLIIIVCSLLSMYIGTFGAINQTKIKRLFAYSSIAHVGYILIGLATGTIEAIESLLIYIIIYIIMVLCVFSAILVMSKHEMKINSRINNEFHLMHIPSNIASYTTNVGSDSTNYFTNDKKNENYQDREINGTNTLLKQNNYYKFKYMNNTNFINEDSTNYQDNKKIANKVVKNVFNLQEHLSKIENTLILLQSSNPLYNHYQDNHVNYEYNNKNVTKVNYVRDAQKTSINSVISLKKKDEYIKYITDFSSLSKTNPLLAFTLAIIFFSNAGVPPLSGFYGKLNVFLAAVEGSMYFLAFAAIICSVIGAFYSIRLIKILYYHNIITCWVKWTFYKQIPKENSFVLGLTFFFTLFLFLYPSFLWTITHIAALSLCS